VVDVGGGTGFCTQGVVAAGVDPTNITLIDQSPAQLAKARGKADLQGITIVEVGTQLRRRMRSCTPHLARLYPSVLPPPPPPPAAAAGRRRGPPFCHRLL
jgi:hypothetical protein